MRNSCNYWSSSVDNDGRQWHRSISILLLLVQLCLLILVNDFVALAESSFPKHSRVKTPTRVLGFASSKQSTMLSPEKKVSKRKSSSSSKNKKKSHRKKNETKHLDPSRLYVQYAPSHGILYFQSNGTIVQVSADGQRTWESKILPEYNTEHQNSTLDSSSTSWVPLEGLFGLYSIPSGTIWVLITGSEAVYESPPTRNGQTLLSIRRVTDIELVHIPCRLLSVAQLKEEVRQVQLLRKALKQHDFYYIPKTSAGIVPDMTKNIQRSFRELMGNFSSQSRDNQLMIMKESDEEEPERIENITMHNETKGEESSTIQHCEGADETDEPLPQSIDIDTAVSPWWEHQDSKDAANRPDSRFFWNEVAVEPLIQRYQHDKDNDQNSSKLLLENIVPLTSAFVGVQRQILVENTTSSNTSTLLSYDQLLISRRSRYRAGTRFTKRGADATGAVANYAETEQICLLLSNPKNKSNTSNYLLQLSSHVQTRGSIPLRWSSPTDIKTYRPRVRIGMDPMAQTRAFLAHVTEQLSLYTIPLTEESSNATCPKLLFVNLVDKKSDQGRLGRAFDAVLNAVMEVYAPQNATNVSTVINNIAALNTIKERNNMTYSVQVEEGPEQCITLQPNSVQHLWYDFHAEVKNGRWDRLRKLLEQVKPILLEHGYFSVEAPQKSNPQWNVVNYQKAVVRTNCMDCLDRTNVVQGLFGRFMLFHQLQRVSKSVLSSDDNGENIVHTEKVFTSEYVKAFKKNLLMALPWENGELAHRLLWADNADAISRLYAGTPALKGDFTRTGKRTKRGALDDGMNSLQRYYLNNFLDADRQEGTDLMVGYAPFSNIDDTEGDGSASNDKNTDISNMTLQEAARQMLLGNNVFKTRDADEQSFARIKQYENLPYLRQPLERGGASVGSTRKGRPRYRDLRRPPLDLRWLPGDLQDNLRSRALAEASDSDAKLNAQFSSAEALAAIDRRAASNEPWWVAVDSSDEGDALVDHKTAKAELGATINHAGYVLSSLLIGTRAPLPTAAFTVGLLGVMYFPISKQQQEKKVSDEQS